jgi:hypothetical protein
VEHRVDPASRYLDIIGASFLFLFYPRQSFFATARSADQQDARARQELGFGKSIMA